MTTPAFQDLYPEDVAHCYGCGRLNDAGHQIKTHWDGDTSVTVYTPRAEHKAIPGYVYGGLIASLIDCHGTGTASAAKHRADGKPLDVGPYPRFVTASLTVNYKRPTPLGPPLEIRGTVVELKGRKVVVDATLSANGEVCATGQIICVEMPDTMRPAGG